MDADRTSSTPGPAATADGAAGPARPLDGVTVIELSSWVFVPIAGAILADLGADVIKVEPRSGDPLRATQNSMSRLRDLEGRSGPSPFVEMCNRGKRSMAVDLGDERGRELLYRIAATTDVFMTSFLPDVRRRLGVDVDDIRRIKPDVIFAHGTGWGSHGPMSDAPGYDLTTAWSGTGLAHLMRGNDGEPPPMPMGIFDVQTGTALAGAVAAALFKRERTGEGSVVESALLNAGMWAIQSDITAAEFADDIGRMERTRPGNALVNWYRTKDDRWIYLCVMYAGPLWAQLCELIGRPELVDDPRFHDDPTRTEHAIECARVLDETFANRTYAQWIDTLRPFVGAWGPMRRPRDMHEHPQVVANGFINRHKSIDGFEFGLVAPPMQFDGQPTRPAGPAPELGQHSEEILLHAGFDWDEIGSFIGAGVIGPG